MADLLYWIWLNTVVTPGSETFTLLHAAYSTPYDIYSADEMSLRAVLKGRHSAAIPALMKKDLRRSYAILDYLSRTDVGVVTYDDPNFPAPLRKIKNPPMLLYYRGTLPDFDMTFGVSIVGSRHHSDYAARHTFHIARDLAISGATIVSGLALGIDGVASAGALSGGGKVIAVIGSGIDIIYPSEHTKLAEMIENNGVIFTEYPPGTPPYGKNFPKRNRLISALGHALLVTSGTLKSGTLITAAAARQQGKPIFAVPGDIDSALNEAPSLLLREGAHAVVCAEDILFRFEEQFPYIINIFRLLDRTDVNMGRVLKHARVASASEKRGKRKHPIDSVVYDLPDEEESPERVGNREPKASNTAEIADRLAQLPMFVQDVYHRIPEDRECGMDELVNDECPISRVMVAITKLEMAKLAKQLPGGGIVRAHTE